MEEVGNTEILRGFTDLPLELISEDSCHQLTVSEQLCAYPETKYKKKKEKIYVNTFCMIKTL